MVRILALLPALLAAALPAVGQSPGVRAVGYSLDVDIDPEAGSMRVAGVVRAVREDLNSSRLEFALHETFDIESLAVNGHTATFSIEPGDFGTDRPAAKKVVVQLPERVREPYLDLDIQYGGTFARLPQFGSEEARTEGRALDDSVNGRRVELSWYSSWYPQFGDFGARFETVLDIGLPDGWTAAITGAPFEEEGGDGVGTEVWRSPSSNDLVVVAAPRMRRQVVDRSGVLIEVYDTRLPEAFLDREVENAASILQCFTRLLGDPLQSRTPVKVVYSPRLEGQGGYTRPGMIVLSEGRVLEALAHDPRISLLRGIAHEAGHFWWNFGSGPGDWINETFAEYFALVAVGEIDAAAAVERTLAAYGNAVSSLPDDAPALADVDASNSGHGYTIRYAKGSLMLHALRRAMGDDAFFKASRDFYQRFREQRISTDEFREFWRSRLGDSASLVDIWVDSPGGVPS